MTVLAFDTSGAWCAAALLQGDTVLGARSEDMSRGQAERLIPLLQDLLRDHALTWQDLTRIGVGIGPGNFTGIRISVSAARGLAMGLGVPAIGVSSFDALVQDGAAHAAVAGPRETAYFSDGTTPQIVAMSDLPSDTAVTQDPAVLASQIARIAAHRQAGPAPAPLYIRAADAAPARDAPPVILDDA